jgi:hypothetical protein
MAAEHRHPHLGQAQPRAGPDHLGGQERQPPLNRRSLAWQEGCVEVALDQLGRPHRIPGGHRVPQGIIGQLMFLMPGG